MGPMRLRRPNEHATSGAVTSVATPETTSDCAILRLRLHQWNDTPERENTPPGCVALARVRSGCCADHHGCPQRRRRKAQHEHIANDDTSRHERREAPGYPNEIQHQREGRRDYRYVES